MDFILSHMITQALSCRKLASAGTHCSSVYFPKFVFYTILIFLLLTFATAFLCYIHSSVKWTVSFPMVQFLSHRCLYYSIASSLWVIKTSFNNYSNLLDTKILSLRCFISPNRKSLALQFFKSLSHQMFISPVLGPLSHQEFNCPVLQSSWVTKNLIVKSFRSLKSPII